MKIKDIAQYEDTDSELAKYTITMLEQEIERLNNDIKELLKENSNKEKVIIAQDNIIKEVREYVDKWEDIARYKLLEMLDKENI